ncbi:MAG: Xaa-Pro peptidase family protein [Candidatus Aureabacteria bacterium]|nr:Xaa-Pro peptidase family protein [Candidatus Auribacterota bacterium]
MAHNRRLKSLVALLESHGLESLFVTSIPNIRYLTGFTGSSASCLVSSAGCLFFTDFRYQLQARGEIRGFDVATVGAGELFPQLAARVRSLNLTQLGFEPASLSYGSYREMKRALSGACRLYPAGAMVERLRMLKDKEEIALILRLARMTDNVLSCCLGEIRAGMTEREVETRLEYNARTAGADALAFRPIVASGSRAAMPHYRCSRYRLSRGKPLLIDFGLEVGGYNSDLTRTFQLGKLTKRYREIYGIVLEAQQLALKEIRPGAAASSVDACAREHIASRGFERHFGHGLGHGLGLEVHEAPRLNRKSLETLEAGMVCTVEPGIYMPGWGGVRIEDMVLVEAGGCRVLTSSAKGIEESVL